MIYNKLQKAQRSNLASSVMKRNFSVVGNSQVVNDAIKVSTNKLYNIKILIHFVIVYWTHWRLYSN